MRKTGWWWVIAVLFLFFLGVCLFRKDHVAESNKKFDLVRDGVTVIPNCLTKEEIEKLKRCIIERQYEEVQQEIIRNGRVYEKIQAVLQDTDYVFQEYVWIIKRSNVHTCHRDNNGDFFNPGQKHPSYTMLFYLEDMEKCLGVIPSSHQEKGSFPTNFDDRLIHMVCNPGDVVLFNANLIHVGALNEREDNMRVQMKMSHREDLDVLGYYQDFHKVLDRPNGLPGFLKQAQKNASCMFPIMSDLTQGENIRTARGSDNGVEVGMAQRIFSTLFYGDGNFYDLPNAY